MPIKLALSDALIEEAVQIGNHRTKNEAVTAALKEYVQARKYTPVSHDHTAFLAKAHARKGFTDAYESLELDYQIADQLLKAQARAGLTQDRSRRAE